MNDTNQQIGLCNAQAATLGRKPEPDSCVTHPQLVQLRQKDIATWRAKLLAQQNNICLVCQTKISDSDKPALDHQHGKKGVKIGDNKSGLVRGVLHDQCNRFEGACVVYVLYCLFVCLYRHTIPTYTNIFNNVCMLDRQGVFGSPAVLQLYRPAWPAAQPGRLLRAACNVADSPVGKAKTLASQKTKVQPTGQAGAAGKPKTTNNKAFSAHYTSTSTTTTATTTTTTTSKGLCEYEFDQSGNTMHH
jgi:hypothetical protein